MRLSVQMFAAARDLAGAGSLQVDLPAGATVAALRHELTRICPALSRLAPSLLIAVDQDYADNGTTLNEGAEVACFPPVSGG